jgi:hypothetical protein
VTYAEFVPTVDGHRSKAEIRMMFLWPEDGEPILVNNLVRMSQGRMMGVDFNKDKTWVGSSIALHPTRVTLEDGVPFPFKNPKRQRSCLTAGQAVIESERTGLCRRNWPNFGWAG